MSTRIFHIAIGYLLTIILGFIVTSLLGNLFNNILTDSHIGFKGSANPEINSITFFIVGVLLAPFFEEIIFRYPLKHLKLKEFLLSISCYFFFISFSNTEFITTLSFLNINYRCLFISFLFLLIWLKIKKNIALNVKYRYLVVVIFSILFGILHFIKFDQLILNFNNWQYLIEVLISSITTIFSGLYFSYIRIKFDLKTSITAHFSTNLLAFIFKFII